MPVERCRNDVANEEERDSSPNGDDPGAAESGEGRLEEGQSERNGRCARLTTQLMSSRSPNFDANLVRQRKWPNS